MREVPKFSFLSLNFIIESNVVRTSVTHWPNGSCCAIFCSYHSLTQSVIHY